MTDAPLSRKIRRTVSQVAVHLVAGDITSSRQREKMIFSVLNHKLAGASLFDASSTRAYER